jgi:hypothetical protein
MREMASILRDATFHPHLYSYEREGRRPCGLYIYGLDETRLFHRMIGFVGRKGLRLSKVISQFECRGAQPGTARWRSKTPPSVAVKHSNGARPKRPLDGSGSRSKEKKPADGRPKKPDFESPPGYQQLCLYLLTAVSSTSVSSTSVSSTWRMLWPNKPLFLPQNCSTDRVRRGESRVVL